MQLEVQTYKSIIHLVQFHQFLETVAKKHLLYAGFPCKEKLTVNYSEMPVQRKVKILKKIKGKPGEKR
jgi:hypothetical protein